MSPFLLGQSFSDVSTEVCPMAEEGETQVRVVISRDLGSELIFTDNRACIHKETKSERRLLSQTQLQKRRKCRAEAILERRKDFHK